MIRHYYHVYADGLWRNAVHEHIAAINAIDHPIEMTVGLVGDVAEVDAATRVMADGFGDHVNVLGTSWAAAGHEQLTLDRLKAEAEDHDDVILYAHTKGANNAEGINVDWRRCMTKHTIGKWELAYNALKLTETEVVGSHWFDPRQQVAWQKPYFAGNFWWATAAYIRSLPPLIDRPEGGTCSCGCKPGRCRYTAELWIGLNDPKIYDLMPGAPGHCKEHI